MIFIFIPDRKLTILASGLEILADDIVPSLLPSTLEKKYAWMISAISTNTIWSEFRKGNGCLWRAELSQG